MPDVPLPTTSHPKPMIRYLRQNNGAIWIWNETLAKRDDMVEVYARNPEDARQSLPTESHSRIREDQLVGMTRAQLIAYAWDQFRVRLDPATKHADMVALIKDEIAKKRDQGDQIQGVFHDDNPS